MFDKPHRPFLSTLNDEIHNIYMIHALYSLLPIILSFPVSFLYGPYFTRLRQAYNRHFECVLNKRSFVFLSTPKYNLVLRFQR